MTTTKTSIGPTVSELKDQFMARSIPLEADFSDLIDIADVGRKAVGQSPEQTPNPTSGLTLGTNGQQKVQLKPEAGLMVDNSGVGLVPEQQLSRGMIMMFSGSTVPAGWALCNGDNGTPDLRNRFVLGGNLSESGSRGGANIVGNNSNKSYSVNTSSTKTNVSVSVNNHTLTLGQIPGHNHWGGARYSALASSTSHYGYTNIGQWSDTIDIHATDDWDHYHLKGTSTAGGGQAHKHGASVSEPTHKHNITTLPSYYILAFIMKL